MSGDLSGVSVLIAGAGLSGLAAARDLAAMGADITVIDARQRIGGRVWTIHDGFASSQHAEAGGDMIDFDHHELRALAGELGLTLTRILRGGFSYVRTEGSQGSQGSRGSQGSPWRSVIVPRGAARGWDRLSDALADLGRGYRLAEKRWDSPITADLARRSVSDWLDDVKADDDLRMTATGLRGFFLADPEELSLLALVDQFATDESPAPWQSFRVSGGNDRIVTALAKPLGDRLKLDTELAAVSYRGGGVRASIRRGKQVAQVRADYLLFAMPASLLRRIPISPALPAPQHDAIARLKYGRATKTLLQFPRRFWRVPGRARAFGSALPFGAVWDGNEEQRGQPGILSLMAGGSASDATRAIVARDGIKGLANTLDWLAPKGGATGDVIASKQIAWDTDPWARGGYAFFDPGFDPSLREWLARPCGPLFFAGEHTSLQWQGYMNGAVESGRRAAAEIAAAHRLQPQPG
jgi:monoamine oxidase